MNRTVLWAEEGFFLLPDPRHIIKLTETYELQKAKIADTSSSKHTAKEVREAMDPLRKEEQSKFRSCGGQQQYLAVDRWDIQAAVRDLSTVCLCSTVGDELKMKRLIRYLKGTVAVGLFYPYQDGYDTVRVPVDADWSGDVVNCKSVSSGGDLLGAPSDRELGGGPSNASAVQWRVGVLRDGLWLCSCSHRATRSRGD